MWPAPTLPPTPMRIAIAPPTVRIGGNRLLPPVRVDLSNWLQDWHGLTVTSIPEVDHFELYRDQDTFNSRSSAKRLHDFCEAGRNAGLDAVFFTQFEESSSSNLVCTDTFNFSRDTDACDHYGRSVCSIRAIAY